jgi:hypothetical protein
MVAIVAAGVISAVAQLPSFSQTTNLSITVVPGYNLISLPLKNTNDSINTVLTNTYYNGNPQVTPGGCSIFTWDPVHARFNPAIYAGGDGNWYNEDFTLATLPLPPGLGFFFQLITPSQQQGSGDPPPFVTNLTIVVTGKILTGTNSYPVTSGYNFYGNFEPTTNDICKNGFPVVDGSDLMTWNGYGYGQALYGLGTNDSAPDLSGNPGQYPGFIDQDFTQIVPVTPPVGSAFLYYYVGPNTNWTQIYSVGP